jgi:thiamine biosynthesis lipoprotein
MTTSAVRDAHDVAARDRGWRNAWWWLMLSLFGCQDARHSLVTLDGTTMGTTYHVVCAAGEGRGDELRRAIEAELARVLESMSTYEPTSEISRWNALDSTEWFPVSADLQDLVAKSQVVSAKSGGAFDITIGPLVDRWGFGPLDEKRPLPPSSEEIDALRLLIGYENLETLDSPPMVRKLRPGIRVDLSAIAKGYGVDRVAGLLQERGISDFLVEIGGEVKTSGSKHGGRWTIGLEKPDRDERSVFGRIWTSETGLATSGDYRNWLEIGGESFSHVMDPRSMEPARNDLASVTVAHEECATADAWATALLVLGEEEGARVAEAENLAVLFLVREGERIEVKTTPAWNKSHSVRLSRDQ